MLANCCFPATPFTDVSKFVIDVSYCARYNAERHTWKRGNEVSMLFIKILIFLLSDADVAWDTIITMMMMIVKENYGAARGALNAN